MKLIADSGSTKTSWILMHHQKQIMAFETIGMNPFFTKESVINSAINEHLETKQKEEAYERFNKLRVYNCLNAEYYNKEKEQKYQE